MLPLLKVARGGPYRIHVFASESAGIPEPGNRKIRKTAPTCTKVRTAEKWRARYSSTTIYLAGRWEKRLPQPPSLTIPGATNRTGGRNPRKKIHVAHHVAKGVNLPPKAAFFCEPSEAGWPMNNTAWAPERRGKGGDKIDRAATTLRRPVSVWSARQPSKGQSPQTQATPTFKRLSGWIQWPIRKISLERTRSRPQSRSAGTNVRPRDGGKTTQPTELALSPP